MLLLDSTSDLVRVVTSAAADIEVHEDHVDNASGTITPASDNVASITTATTTTLVSSPAASTQRNVRNLSLRNNHASTPCDITVEHTDGTDVATLYKCTLLPGELAVLDQGGMWTHYDAQGAPYMSPGAAAAQADMEAGTSNTVFVTPGRQHFHPSAAKFWAQVTGAGTPALQTSYNVTSIADTGTGRMTVTIATDFSSANWCCQCSVFSSTTSGDEGIPNINAKAAGTVEVGNRIITPAAADPVVGYDVIGYGDQ